MKRTFAAAALATLIGCAPSKPFVAECGFYPIDKGQPIRFDLSRPMPCDQVEQYNKAANAAAIKEHEERFKQTIKEDGEWIVQNITPERCKRSHDRLESYIGMHMPQASWDMAMTVYKTCQKLGLAK